MTAPEWWDEARRTARYVAYDQKSAFLDRDEAESVAIAAIAYQAAEHGRELTRREMRMHAFRAVPDAAHKVMSVRGINVNTGRPAPRFGTYWIGTPRCTSPFEEQLLERLALWQVWAHLDDRPRDVLIAYATAETPAGRARLAGYSPGAWASVLNRARQRARRIWFDWETDPGIYPYGQKRRWAA